MFFFHLSGRNKSLSPVFGNIISCVAKLTVDLVWCWYHESGLIHHLANQTGWFLTLTVWAARGRGLERRHTAGTGDPMKSAMSFFHARWPPCSRKRRAAWGGACSAPRSTSSRAPCWGWTPGRRRLQVTGSPSHLTFRETPGTSHRGSMFTLPSHWRLMGNSSSPLSHVWRVRPRPCRCRAPLAPSSAIGAGPVPAPRPQSPAPATPFLPPTCWASQTLQRNQRCHRSTATSPPRDARPDFFGSDVARGTARSRKPCQPHRFSRKVWLSLDNVLILHQLEEPVYSHKTFTTYSGFSSLDATTSASFGNQDRVSMVWIVLSFIQCEVVPVWSQPANLLVLVWFWMSLWVWVWSQDRLMTVPLLPTSVGNQNFESLKFHFKVCYIVMISAMVLKTVSHWFGLSLRLVAAFLKVLVCGQLVLTTSTCPTSFSLCVWILL